MKAGGGEVGVVGSSVEVLGPTMGRIIVPLLEICSTTGVVVAVPEPSIAGSSGGSGCADIRNSDLAFVENVWPLRKKGAADFWTGDATIVCEPSELIDVNTAAVAGDATMICEPWGLVDTSAVSGDVETI